MHIRLSEGKPEGKRQLGRPSKRWVDNIKMDQDMGKWQALVNAVMNLPVP
jgi:hypothetical protein